MRLLPYEVAELPRPRRGRFVERAVLAAIGLFALVAAVGAAASRAGLI